MPNVLKFPQSQRMPRKDVSIEQALNLESYLPYRVYNLTQNLAFRGKIVIDDVAISVRDWRILALLAARGPRTNQEVADEMTLDAATISRAVKYLRSHAVIDVRRSKRDRRMQLIALTQKGADIHDALAPERKRFSDEVESCLTEEEREGLYLALDKIDAFFAAQRIEHDEWE